ncbi:hypothetical protein SLEP1_g55986 [Rubroshorea leprosula]|uniref:Uncharacterized protein n=1 Tax=Rubroshorea leprosula TaxID=152421 RepID=A0AAV5MJP2_9ROSI|nr:hypothetical protein SLEP1_g55986 [Rubroshorea leprosula]
MASFHDTREFRGNQREDEKVDVISVEPITMIVPPELQDSPRTTVPETSASSSTGGGSDDHWSSTSSDSSREETPREAEGIEEVGCSAPAMSAAVEVVVFEGWESKTLDGRLDNLCKAPKTVPAGFKFRAALHHEVTDGAAIVKGYKKLEEMVRRYQIPRTILIQAGTPNERACSYELALPLLTPNSIKFIIGFMLLCERLGLLAKATVFRLLFLCRLCPSTNRTRWYYISGREKMMIFINIRNKVVSWKRQFVFVRDTRTERISNELAARLSEWRTPNAYMNYPQLTVGDVDLKNRLLDYVKARGLVDLEASVTQEQIALLGRNEQHFGETAPTSTRLEESGSWVRFPTRCTREDFDIEDDVPLIRWRTSTGNQPAPAVAARPANVPPVPAHAVAEPVPTSSFVVGRRIAYPDGFSYVRTKCQAAMLQGMQNFVPPADRLRAKGHVQQHGGHAALIKLMDAFSYTVALFECEQGARVQNRELEHSCKQLASEKASLADEVSCLQSSEMANRAASAESRADELARKVDELKEELEQAQVVKDTSIQVTKEELGRAEERARKAESERAKTLHELSTLRERVSQADQHVARAEASLESTKRLHQRNDAVAIISANTTMDIFNEVRGKMLRVRADFPIGELAIFEGEEIDNEGKSLAPPADTRVRLKWELNEEGLPVWPPFVIEEREDTEGLPSFDAWVANPHDVPVEPSSTPPSAQPQPAQYAAPALSLPDRSSPARSVSAPNDASIPVDLTDD